MIKELTTSYFMDAYNWDKYKAILFREWLNIVAQPMTKEEEFTTYLREYKDRFERDVKFLPMGDRAPRYFIPVKLYCYDDCSYMLKYPSLYDEEI